MLLLALAGAANAVSCNLTKGSACDSNGTFPDCCASGLVCGITSGGVTGTCLVPPNSTVSCSSDSECSVGRCSGGECHTVLACDSVCSAQAECGAACPICAESGGNSSCKSCISAGSATACGSTSDCCTGLFCSPSDSKCTACFGNGTACASDSECCSSRCEFNAAGAKSCLVSRPACSMEGGACSTNGDCCGSPPSNNTLYCDAYNPNPGSALPGTCRNRVPPGASCNASSGINCSTGYSCTSTGSGYRCTSPTVSNTLPAGWLAVGDARFDLNATRTHSGAKSLSLDMSGYPNSYIYDNALVLNNSTVYYAEFWVNKSAGPVRYSIYDAGNDAYLGATGDWLASPRSAQGYEDPSILSASTTSGAFARFGRSFYTLSKNVSHVQLRLYPPLDGSIAYVDDVAVTQVYDFTLLGWIRAGYPQAQGSVLFSQMGTENGSLQGINWTLNSSNWLSMGMYSSGGGSIAPVVNLSDLNLHMFALSVFRAGNYSAYLDGQLVSTAPFSLGRLNNTAPFYIGSAGASGAAFKGTLDEVRLYQRALSASEIAAQYAGYYQDLCLVDINATYSGIANLSAKNISANYNAYLRLRNLLPETLLAMPFDANVSSDLQGAIPDYSRSLSFGTKTGAAWTPSGKIGGAYDFLSATDKIQLSGTLVSGSGDFTLSAWIRPTGSSSHSEYIMGNYGTGNTQGVKFYAYQNKLQLYVVSSSVASSAGTILPNTWYHVAATRRNGEVQLYINGEPDGNGTLSNSIGAGQNFAIGNGPDYSTENFLGTIDEARVFSRALSADEVRALHNDTGLTYYGPLSASTGAACPGGSSSLCAQSVSPYLPSRCGFLGQLCCFYNGAYSCSGAGVICNTSISPPLCQACGSTGQQCCSGSSCTSTSLVCSAGTCQCGASGQPCCLTASGTYNCSLSSLGCNMSSSPPVCATCGGANQTCCAGNNCSSGFTCTAGTCQCGGSLQKCCTGNTCASGLTCNTTTGYCLPPCGVLSAQCCWPGNTCNLTTLACYNGFCDCGPIGRVCCANNTCNAPTYAYCNTTSALCQHCGNLAESCCTGNGNSCNATASLGCNTTSVLCQPCGNLSQVCCANSTCNSGYLCNNTTMRCGVCGGNNQSCCPSNACNAGYSCNNSTTLCQPCGNSSQLCCAGSNCSATFACNTSYSPQPVCESCGATAGQLCCLNATSGAYSNCTGAGVVCNTSASPKICVSCGGSGQSCCYGNNCSAGFACNTTSARCQACGASLGQLCCYNSTSATYNNCTNSSLSCNTTLSPPTCQMPLVCGGSGEACCGGAGASTYYAWRSVASGTQSGPNGWVYIMGYYFTAGTSGTATELCTNAGPGTYTVKIWSSAFADLGNVSVTNAGSGGTTWACASLGSPISLTAGQNYYVGVCLAGVNGYSVNPSPALPKVSANGSANITIQYSMYYSTSGCTLSTPTGTTASTLYGQADFKFQPGAAGTCNTGYTCNASSSCQACGATGQTCCNSTICNSGNICSSGTCAACGGAGQPCCAGSNNCSIGYACNTTSSTCAACGALSGQLCCYNATSGTNNNCTNSSLTCNTTASPPVCYAPVPCGASGQACCGGGGSSAIYYPWRSVGSGYALTGPNAWQYIMGYYFTPNVTGTMTELCTSAGPGTYNVSVWNSAFAYLGSASVVKAGGGTWGCSAVASPISVTAGSSYYVGTCLASTMNGYYSNAAMATNSDNGSARVTLQYSFYYSTAGCVLSTPTTATANMYGQSDFKFQVGAAGTCNSGYTCNASSLCQVCGGSGNVCCNGTTCDTGYACSSSICVACGGSGQACCAGSTCNSGYACNASSLCQACGAVSQPCCSGSTCNAQLTCSSGTCQCGGSGQACCSGTTCNSGYLCNASTLCQACGAIGQVCCSGSTCPTSGSCISGTCQNPCGAYGQACCAPSSTCNTGYTCYNGACDYPICSAGCSQCWCTTRSHAVCSAGTYCYTAGVACLPACGIGAGPYQNCMCGTSVVWWGSCYSSPPSC